MPADPGLRDLVARVGAFHITDGAMKRAQHAIVRRYFEGFDREARAHLRDVDRRLEHTNQVAFNLTAERGVAVKRIEGTQAVLTALAGAEDSP
jgi:hypothetical protein